MWGSLAEEAAQKVRKGSRICVQGQIKQDHWVARTGEKRSKIVVRSGDSACGNMRCEEAPSGGQPNQGQPCTFEALDAV